MANKNPANQITKERRAQMPSRGRNKKSLILEAIKESAALSLPDNASNEDVEKAVFAHLAESAFAPVSESQGEQSNLCLSLLMKKGWPDLKPESAPVEFEFNSGGTPSEQAAQIMKAVSEGQLTVDAATGLINALSQVMKIREIDELVGRIAALERANAGKEA